MEEIEYEDEVWKSLDFTGFKGYEVSNYGRIKSLKSSSKKQDRIMKLRTRKDGYVEVGLCFDHNHNTLKVHRLVAQAFIENKKKLPEINHKDENKSNNRVNNLEWCTKTYNINYGTRNERMVNNTKIRPVTCKSVVQYDLDNKPLKQWDSLYSIEKSLSLDGRRISERCRGVRTSIYSGYIWKFYDDLTDEQKLEININICENTLKAV